MELAWLPLDPLHKAKLLSAGYTTLNSLCNISHVDLSRAIGVSAEESLEILKIAWNSKGSGTNSVLTGARTAWDLLCQETSRKRIVTFCDNLDELLGGGICPREVTELVGVPGIGKTQLGIQLAVNVQIPSEFGGMGGQAIYIDTEGSFMVERACQIAEACVNRLGNIASKIEAKGAEYNKKHHVNDILENIFYYRVCSATDQIALINHLDSFLDEHRTVKLLIVDSVTFHFRQDFEDLALRTRLLGGLAQKLMKLAEKYDIAVVLANQVTTKFSGGSVQLAPALGESWSHSCTNRVILYWEGTKRFAYIDKSPSLRSVSAPFAVSEAGICSLD